MKPLVSTRLLAEIRAKEQEHTSRCGGCLDCSAYCLAASWYRQGLRQGQTPRPLFTVLDLGISPPSLRERIRALSGQKITDDLCVLVDALIEEAKSAHDVEALDVLDEIRDLFDRFECVKEEACRIP